MIQHRTILIISFMLQTGSSYPGQFVACEGKFYSGGKLKSTVDL